MCHSVNYCGVTLLLEVGWFSSLVHLCVQSLLSDLLPAGASGLASRPKAGPIFLQQTMELCYTILGDILHYSANAVSIQTENDI